MRAWDKIDYFIIGFLLGGIFGAFLYEIINFYIKGV